MARRAVTIGVHSVRCHRKRGRGSQKLVAISRAGEIFMAGSEQSLAKRLERVLHLLQDGRELWDTIREFRSLVAPGRTDGVISQSGIGGSW